MITPSTAGNKVHDLVQLDTEDELKELKKVCTDRAIFVLFWASWDEGSEQLKGMMEELPKMYQNVRFAYVDCDSSDLVDTLDVENVQTLVVIHPEGSGRQTAQQIGVKAEQLTELVESENKFYEEWYESEKKKAFRDIESYIGTYPFFIFVKGSKEQPKCKFSKKLAALMAEGGYDYKTFDILQDERIRQWLKVYSKWPTFPQAFINQKFIGGIDVISELIENDEFEEMVPKSCLPLPPKEQLQKILSQNNVVLLINGSLTEPADEESRQLIEEMNKLECQFTAVDVKNKPAFLEYFQSEQKIPYVFLSGKPACGLEGLPNLPDLPGFKRAAPQGRENVIQRIESLLKNDIIVFIKGVPEAPECGFSRTLIQILGQYDGLKYEHYNILQDNELREALKKHSNWPTYPQVYVKGKLVGGIDIIKELHEENELDEALMLS